MAARRSGDEITIARSSMSAGTNLIVVGRLNEGIQLVDEAAERFAKGDSLDHRQGLGWCWILQADLANAGMIKKEPEDVLRFTTKALEIL